MGSGPKSPEIGAGRGILVAILIVLAGCGSLPTIVPDMAVPREPVKMSGALGVLSAEQAHGIIEKLKVSNPESSLLERHLALEQALVENPLVIGNRVMLLQDGAATFKSIFEAARNAKLNINVETFIIEDDDVGNHFADLLIEKQRSGVQVNLMYDSVGSSDTPKAFFTRMADAGVHLVEYNPINPLTAKAGWNVNQRDHRKLIIIDGQIAFLGGVNISSVYSAGSSRQRDATRPEDRAPWRDTHLRLEGPVVADFQRMFLASWIKQKGTELAEDKYLPRSVPKGKEVVRAIGSSPDAGSLMYVTLVSAIRNAESTVWLTNAYFVPDPQLLKALMETARRGVDVRLILPRFTDSWLTLNVGRSYYEDLLASGVKIYERRNRMLHAKTAVIDGVWSTVGSTNLDWRSFLNNDEVNAVVLGKEFADQMKVAYERDVAESDQITLSVWRNRSLMSRVRESFARLWQRGL